MKKIAFIGLFVSLFFPSMAQKLSFKSRFPIVTGNEKWDYMAVFKDKLFVSHGDRVHVIQTKDGKSIAEFDSLKGVHGIAIAQPFNKGYITNGTNNEITVFDLSNFQVIKSLKIAGKKADAILFDSFSKRIFVFNNGSGDAVVIDPKNDSVLGLITMGGAPEFAVSNLKGSIFNNNEDTNEVIEIDAISLKIKNRFSLAPNEVATGLTMDLKNNRLFSVCRKTNTIVILDGESGKIIQTLPIGGGVDGVVFDPVQKIIITSNGEGNATVIRQNGADSYEIVQTIPTAKGQKTISIDEANHQVFLSSASYLADGKTPEPGTFGVTVYQIK
jgi:YVTN family beta-propeller protein